MNAYIDESCWSQKKHQKGFTSTIWFREENAVFAGHYPSNPIFPASLIIDICYGQLCHFLDVYSCLELRLAVSRAVINQGIRPGETVEFACQLEESENPKKRFVFLLRNNDLQIGRIDFSSDENTKPNLIIPNLPSGVRLESAIKHLPQRHPLLAVDRILASTNREFGYAKKLVSFGDYAFRKAMNLGHNEALTAYSFGAIIEGIEQSAAVVLSSLWPITDSQKEISIAGFSNIRLFKQVFPGDTLDFYSIVQYQSDENAIVSGVALVDNEPVVAIEKIFVVIKSISEGHA